MMKHYENGTGRTERAEASPSVCRDSRSVAPTYVILTREEMYGMVCSFKILQAIKISFCITPSKPLHFVKPHLKLRAC